MPKTLIASVVVAALVGAAGCKKEEKASAPATAPDAPPAAPPAPKAPPDPNAPADVKGPPADAEKTASGLASKVLTAAPKDKKEKEKPAPEDVVKVHYTGWTTDGVKFDSSVDRGEPAQFPVNGVIKGWTEGLQLMVAGEKRLFWIPGSLGYGDGPGRPGGPPTGMLVFDVELLQINKPPKAPEDVAAPPKTAKKTKSGIAYKVLKRGTGKAKPKPDSVVEVHYTGWTTDGKMFDSSVARGQPAAFPLNGVIKGWTEGVQLMTVGEKTRFWIPGELAYGNSPQGGAPAGMLVFEIELLAIK